MILTANAMGTVKGAIPADHISDDSTGQPTSIIFVSFPVLSAKTSIIGSTFCIKKEKSIPIPTRPTPIKSADLKAT